MSDSTAATAAPASPDLQALVDVRGPPVQEILEQVQAFRRQPPTPERTCAFEQQVAARLREAGRGLLERVYNALEPERLEDCPLRLRYAGATYRRRPKSRNRVGTRFGAIDLRRYLYEATEPGERSLFPLELHLGIEAGLATPALAEGLFGAGARAWGWFRKWRRWLRDRTQGGAQVLRSARWSSNHGPRRTKAGEALCWKGDRYLRRHAAWLRYAQYRRQGLPIGSGVTEAACKTVFAERRKRSGMTWGRAGGQVIVDPRTLVVSGK